ncbi:DUF1266 domain-containing protein [Variovorax sp.]|uniref:DUF1266 domain-containing protein n=1 Tax=Variovorax sp. TaxID=1871043 RepID=UPI00137F941D|nr:DUF1266 domain-containing protein [Variovorax sp.]KAF1068194.1 MAG: hypothetical protein GAK39_03604 [Variovorax sp.]
MFKFFKEMLDTVKEGMAEGRAELAQEAAEREAKAQQDGATLEARLAASSRYENMAVALAAIYRETFAPELKAAKEANRSAVHLLCVPIPDEEVAPWKKLLARDFDTGDEAQAREAIADTHDAAEAMARSADSELAVWIARFAHLATGSAAVGYLEAREALDALEPAVALAIERFDGWESYGRGFLEGERDAAGSNFMGRKVLASVTERLLEDERSPWKTLDWPARDALPALLASR